MELQMDGSQGTREDIDLGALRSVARIARRMCPGLAPLGGRDWGPEDIDRVVSIAYEISRSDAFLARFPGGPGGWEARTYLLTSVKRRLLRDRMAGSRVAILPDPALDALPSSRYRTPRLLAPDAQSLAERVLAMLEADEVDELHRHLRGEEAEGEACKTAGTPRRQEGPSSRTRDRPWKKVKAVLRKVREEEDLGREEMRDVLTSMQATLEDGSPRISSGIPGEESTPRDSAM